MRQFGIAAASLILILAAWLSLFSGEDAGNVDQAHDALIVREGVLTEGGVGKVSALRVADPRKLSALEAHFPGYRERPSSDAAGGWEVGYRVYFNFPGGETVRVTISENGKGRYWSVGHGDFTTDGDFVRFVEGLGL